MSFEFLSPLGLFGGLLGLAGALFALHRLRVRHREIIVPTTLFWKQAVEDTLARKLTAQFRHPRAYAFVLAILALLWLALAGPLSSSGNKREYVVLLDGSADMARGDTLVRGLAVAEELLDALPREHTRLVFADQTPHTILGPGEASLLFETRTAGLSASAAPETITAELMSLARSAKHNTRGTTALIVGEATLPGGLIDALAKASNGRLEIQRVHGAGNEAQAESAQVDGPKSETISSTDRKPTGDLDDALIALGIAPAASGDWGAADLWIEVMGELQPTIEGIDASRITRDSSSMGWWVRDFPLAGLGDSLRVQTGVAEASTSHPYALELDDRAMLQMPADRATISVWLGESVPAVFTAAVLADPGLGLVETASGAIAVGSELEIDSASGAIATWTLAAADSLQASVVASQSPASFASIFASLDLASIEKAVDKAASKTAAEGTLEQGSSPITYGERSSSEPALWMDDALFAAPYDLIESHSFPLLVGFAARWLAGSETMIPFAAAGHSLVGGGARMREQLTSEAGLNFSTAGNTVVPPAAGNYSLGGTRPLTASLLSLGSAGAPVADLLTTGGSAAVPSISIRDFSASGNQNFATWALLLALILLLIEWQLYRTGRMP